MKNGHLNLQFEVCLQIFDGETPLGGGLGLQSCSTPENRSSSPAVATLEMDMPADAKLWSPDSPFLYLLR